MIKICLDTNVIISAIIFGGKPEQILKLAQEGKITLLISPAILSEINRVLAIKFERDDTEIKRVVKGLISIGQLVSPKKKIDKIQYKPDNRILECALEGKADYIISGDKKHLLPLGKFEGIKIVTSSQFLQVLRELEP